MAPLDLDRLMTTLECKECEQTATIRELSAADMLNLLARALIRPN